MLEHITGLKGQSADPNGKPYVGDITLLYYSDSRYQQLKPCRWEMIA